MINRFSYQRNTTAIFPDHILTTSVCQREKMIICPTTPTYIAHGHCLRGRVVLFVSPPRHHCTRLQGAGRSSEVERSLMVRWVVGSILHGVDPLSYFSFQPVLHDWCNKGRGMCYPVCGMVHIKEPLLLIDKSLTPYHRR